MRKPAYLRLGVNIDHVATIRNARGGRHPDPVRAAHLAVEAGADGITAHLREDRRHISDDDIARLKAELTRPLNLEMAATEEMLAIALRHVPQRLLPRARAARGAHDRRRPRRRRRRRRDLRRVVGALKDAGIRVSLFIEPDAAAVEAVAAHRRRHRRAAHRRLLRARAGGRRGRRRPRARAHARPPRGSPPRPASRSTPAMASTFDTVARRRAHAADRRAQHRPLPDRRGHLRRPRRGDPAHARADGRGPPGAARRPQARSA